MIFPIRGRNDGIEATNTQRFSSIMAHSAASTALTGRCELAQSKTYDTHENIHVGSNPGNLCARTRRHNRTAETTVTLPQDQQEFY